MKKLSLMVMVVLMMLTLAACNKEVKGNYSAFDKSLGKVDLTINETSVSLKFPTKIKAAEAASSGLFAPEQDTSIYEMNGTIDTKKKVLALKTMDGQSFEANYELKGDTLSFTIDGISDQMDFYKVDSDDYKDTLNNFDEDSVMQNMQF